MNNDNSNDGRNASDGRVYVSTGGGTGSIWDVAREQGINPNDYADDRSTYGINNGLGLRNDRNADATVYRPSPADMGGGIKARRSGFSVTGGSLQPGDIVTLPGGMEVSYEDAVAHGLIKATGNGGNGDGGGNGARPAAPPDMDEDTADQEQQDQPKSSRETDGLGPEAYDVMSAALERAPGAVTNAASDIISSADGTLTEAAAIELAGRLGISPVDAQRQASVAIQGYQRDASLAMQQATGFHPDLIHEALNDARATRPSETKEAMLRHYHEGRTDVYLRFVTEYVAALGETAPHRLIGRDIDGVRPFVGPNNQVMVRAGGVEMRWSDYINGGWHRKGRR